ncbi:MAG: DUF1444 family protein [Rhodospirillaceae bacterium]|nr:DUF1444 family protein [Rhodospirillaceae bacterium]
MRILDFFRSRPSQDQFAGLVVRQLQRDGWNEKIDYDRERFALALGDEYGILYLHNLHAEWNAAGRAEKHDVVARAAAFAREQKAEDIALPDVMALLLPVVRNLSHLRNQWLDPSLKADRDSFDYALKEFCGSLAISVAIDRPNSIKILAATRLKQWSRTVDDLLPTALDNLRAISPSKFDRTKGGFFVSKYDDNYDASRLLLTDLFANLPLRGDPVAVAVSRSCLAVCGSRELDALEAMAHFVEGEIDRDQRAISFLPLVLRDGSWRRFDFPDGNVPALSRLRAKQDLWDYTEQKTLLESHFERTGRDVFVASLNALEHEGRCHTWAVWTTDAMSLLPRADALAIRLNDDDTIVRTWTDIEAHCGPLRAEPDTTPTRYLVERRPSDECLQSLRACPAPEWLPDPKR